MLDLAGGFSVRVFGSSGLIHCEIDFGAWDTPEAIGDSSKLYIQCGRDGFSKREVLDETATNMFTAELDMFAESCRTGRTSDLSAANGNEAASCAYAALASIERNAAAVKLSEFMAMARANGS